MVRNLAVAAGQAALLVLFSPPQTRQLKLNLALKRKPRPCWRKQLAALKENKEKALEMFNKGEGGFKDRDLYVFSADSLDGVLTAHPNLKGEHLQDIVGKKGYPLGKKIVQAYRH